MRLVPYARVISMVTGASHTQVAITSIGTVVVLRRYRILRIDHGHPGITVRKNHPHWGNWTGRTSRVLTGVAF